MCIRGAPLPHTPAARGIQEGTRIQQSNLTDLLSAALPPGMLQSAKQFLGVQEEVDGVKLSFQVCALKQPQLPFFECRHCRHGLGPGWRCPSSCMTSWVLVAKLQEGPAGWRCGPGKAGSGLRGGSRICGEGCGPRAALGAWEDRRHTPGCRRQGSLQDPHALIAPTLPKKPLPAMAVTVPR